MTMNVKELKKDGLVRQYEVTLPGDVFTRELNARLVVLGQKRTVPGFRKGKVPLPILKQSFEKEATGAAIDHTIQEHVKKVLADKKLKPAMNSQCSLKSFGDDKAVTFEMTVEEMPEIKLPDFAKFNLEQLKIKLDEKEVADGVVDRFINEDLSGKAITDRGAQKGDVIAMSYRLKVAKEQIDEANFFICRLGAKSTLEEFQKNLEGVKKGESKEFTMTFPKDYGGPDIQGKKGTFEVEIKEVHEATVPNDEFAKKRGFETLDAMRKASVQFATEDATHHSFVHIKRHVLDMLDEKCKFDVPPTMLDNEFKHIWNKLLKENAEDIQKMSEKETEKTKKEYQELAQRRVRLGLLINHLSAEEKIKVTNEELQSAVIEDARRNYPGREEQFFKFVKENPRVMDQYHGTVLERKAVELIISRAKVKDKELAADAFHKEMQEVLG